MPLLHDGEGFSSREDVRIWYRVEGAKRPGVPLLLVHGGPGATARPFERSIGPLLATTRPVVYLDTRGAGRSDRPSDLARYTFAALAADIVALRQHLGVERWAVFGHSLGAITALTYAAAFPNQVAALLLCGPNLDGQRSLLANIAGKVARAPTALRPEAQRIYISTVSAEARFAALNALLPSDVRAGFQFYAPATHTILDAVQQDLAAEIGQPLMCSELEQGLVADGLWRFDGLRMLGLMPAVPQAVLISPWDGEVSVEAAYGYAAASGAALLNYRHSGHHPYLEETATCARDIEAFLSGARS